MREAALEGERVGWEVRGLGVGMNGGREAARREAKRGHVRGRGESIRTGGSMCGNFWDRSTITRTDRYSR